MPRPVTLFTGQWADLPFEEVAGWPPNGATTASRSPARATISTSTGRWPTTPTSQGTPRDPGRVRPEGLRHLEPPRGPGRLRRPDRRAAPGHPADAVWGDGDPEGVRQRAAEEMKNTARAAAGLGVDTVVGFTGSSIWKYVAMFPPVPADMIDAGYQDFADRWNPILDVFDEVGVRFAHEVHPSEIAYDYWTTVRTLEAIGHRPGVRPQLGPQPHGLAGPRPGRVHLGLPRPDLPRRLQGHQASARQRPQRPARLAPAVGRPAPRLGLRVHRPRRRAVGGLLPDAQRHRLRRPDLDRVGGRRNGPAARRAGGARVRPGLLPSSRRPPRSTPPSPPT